MKVLIFMPIAKQRGGGELMLIDLLKHADTQEVDWLVIFAERGPMVREVRDMGITSRVIETGRLRAAHKFAGTIWQLVRLIRQEQVDLVLSWSAKPHLYGGLAALIAGVPAVWYQLGYPVGRHLNLVDKVATLIPAQAVITLSQAAQHGQDALWPSRPSYLVYPSVRLDQFDSASLPSPREARHRLGLSSNGPIIGMVGRLQRWKGMHTLIEAMPNVLDRHPDARAVIVGGKHELEPGYKRTLHQRIDALGLQENVMLVGYQSNVPTWMQAMDVVVHASDNEPFGIVIIEAMALGKPVVTGDRGGPPEIITEGRNGLTASFEDADGLAKQINRYLDDPSFADQVGEMAVQRAKHFSPSRYADSLMGVLSDLHDQ